jgi:hypothetical protein
MDSDTAIKIFLFVVAIPIIIFFAYRYWQRCQRQKTGRQLISDLLSGYFNSELLADQLGPRVREIADRDSISDVALHSLARLAFQRTGEAKGALGAISEADESKLLSLLYGLPKVFGLTDNEVKELIRKMGKAAIVNAFKGYLHSDIASEKFVQQVQALAGHHFISGDALHLLARDGFDESVDEFVNEKVFSRSDERRLTDLLSALRSSFSITDDEVEGSIERMHRAAVLRGLDAGVMNPLEVKGLSIVFQKKRKGDLDFLLF